MSASRKDGSSGVLYRPEIAASPNALVWRAGTGYGTLDATAWVQEQFDMRPALHLERLESRELLAGGMLAAAADSSIRGSIFSDRNNNGVRDAGETGLAGVTVYLDLNHNGRLDVGERSARTAADGSYSFTGLAAGTYLVAQVAPPGWTPAVAPASVVTASVATRPASAADQLIGLDRFRADPRFAGIDGRGGSVVVIDTGIDPKQSSFGPDRNGDGVADSIVFETDFTTAGKQMSDRDGHGTEVASLIASRSAQNPGVAPGVSLIVLKVFDGNGKGSFATIESALHWVLDNASTYRIACVNLSIGDQGTYDHPVRLDGLDDDLAALVARNITILAAAGNGHHGLNSGFGLDYPAADPSVIPVGSVWDKNRGSGWQWSADTRDNTTGPDRIVSFSQRLAGSGEIFAPGTELVAALPGGGTTPVSGTSVSTAVVSGVVALAQQLANRTLGRMLIPAEVRNLLQRTGKTILDSGGDDTVSHTGATFSRVDVFALGEAILRMARPGTLGVTVSAHSAATANLGLVSPTRIAGLAFRDANGNGRQDGGETVAAGVTVFADKNHNGRLDPGERFTVSASNGWFELMNLDPGTYDILQLLPGQYKSTTPAIRVVIAAGFTRADLRLGSQYIASGHGPVLL
jgi:subtilisin family serine protease